MWIIKILVLISVIGTRADIDEIPDDLINGYLYDPPEAIPAELAFYVNIPAGHDYSSYISGTADHFQQPQHSQSQIAFENNQELEPSYQHNRLQSQSNEQVEPSYQHNRPSEPTQHSQSQIAFENHEEVRPSYQHNRPSEPELPFIRENSGYNIISPPQHTVEHQHHHQPQVQHYHQPQPQHHHQHQYQHQQQNYQHNQPQYQDTHYQIEPRIPHQSLISSPNSFNYNQGPAQILFPEQQRQHFQNMFTISQELLPPGPQVQLFTPHIQPQNTESVPHHRLIPSIDSSYNALLPFPFGVAPLKFAPPLPIKSHLPQEELLRLSEFHPVTSYDVKRLYKKKK